MPNALVVAPLTRVLVVTDRGPPGATGAAGAAGTGSLMPFYIAADETYTVPAYQQGLFSVPIEVDGVLTVDGLLVEVD